MTDPKGRVPRLDRAVIMARGSSLRMGVPKGLLRFDETGPVFLRLIADLYLAVGFPVDVVAREENVAAYRAELPGEKDIRVLSADAGGETALTILTAWRCLKKSRTEGLHIWAHPVDLPLVQPGTIRCLVKFSADHPGQVVRPGYRGVPGHPVILPDAVLAELERCPRWHDRPLRDFLEASASGVMVPVEDEGTVRDFDRPDDFGPAMTQRNTEVHDEQ